MPTTRAQEAAQNRDLKPRTSAEDKKAVSAKPASKAKKPPSSRKPASKKKPGHVKKEEEEVPAVGEKGYFDTRVEVLTPGGHSSIPPAHTVCILCALSG